ncbi:archease [Candidatus Omnitrophota bacterium]
MKPYEIIEHTADVGVKAYGVTIEHLFENAAKGMFDIISGKSGPQNSRRPIQKKIQIIKSTKNFEERLVDWLSELLYIFNKEEILFSDFKLLRLDNDGIDGEAYGKKIDLSQNTLQTEIKAVTFHGLKIEQDKNGFNCEIIFDV